jgi:hypothetical protein
MGMKSGMNQGEKSEQQVIVQRQRRIPSLLVWVALVLPNIVFLGGGVVGLARAQVKNSPQRPDKSDDSQEPKPDKNAAAEKNKKVSARGVPGFDLQSSRTDILSHLNAVISFYRASLMPIQKAGSQMTLFTSTNPLSFPHRLQRTRFRQLRPERRSRLCIRMCLLMIDRD